VHTLVLGAYKFIWVAVDAIAEGLKFESPILDCNALYFLVPCAVSCFQLFFSRLRVESDFFVRQVPFAVCTWYYTSIFDKIYDLK